MPSQSLAHGSLAELRKSEADHHRRAILVELQLIPGDEFVKSNDVDIKSISYDFESVLIEFYVDNAVCRHSQMYLLLMSREICFSCF